jgi:hypothetical protein
MSPKELNQTPLSSFPQTLQSPSKELASFRRKAHPMSAPHKLTLPQQSQAIRANGTIYVSGQIPADASGNLVEGNIGTLTQACCNNIQAIVTAAGSSVGKIVKVNVCVCPALPAPALLLPLRYIIANLRRSSLPIWPTLLK